MKLPKCLLMSVKEERVWDTVRIIIKIKMIFILKKNFTKRNNIKTLIFISQKWTSSINVGMRMINNKNSKSRKIFTKVKLVCFQ